MTSKELQEYLTKRFPIENEQWEWKEFARLKHAVKGQEGEDIRRTDNNQVCHR